MPTMDWKKETNNNPIYPKGTYKVRCKGFERNTAKTGTPQIRWDAIIISPEDLNGRLFCVFTSLTQASLWKIASLIKGFGVDTTKLDKMDTDSDTFDQICQACVNRTSFWRNEEGHDQNNNPRNNVVDFKIDDEQDIISFEAGADAPDWAK